ncbi:hypothetical protein HY338_01870, partial [Candidatus Gottesmanbacteria bacterium]|nr:hypothetical protein [Candidatus Gottesmanbacteria bacterium]
IIRILPLDKKIQEKLLEGFDKLSPDKKFSLEEIVWDTYEAIYKLKLQENIGLALLRAKSSQEKLDEDFYKRAKQQTEKEMETDLSERSSKVNISDISTKLESIISQ